MVQQYFTASPQAVELVRLWEGCHSKSKGDPRVEMAVMSLLSSLISNNVFSSTSHSNFLVARLVFSSLDKAISGHLASLSSSNRKEKEMARVCLELLSSVAWSGSSAADVVARSLELHFPSLVVALSPFQATLHYAKGKVEHFFGVFLLFLSPPSRPKSTSSTAGPLCRC